MFSFQVAESQLRVGKRRCPVCGTKKMSRRDDGRMMCKYGHEQAGVFEEDNEGITEGSTRRYTKRLNRETKAQKAKNRRMYGRNAYFLILQGMQHILRIQVTMLVENEGAPKALIETTKILWLRYVSKLSDVNTHVTSEARLNSVPDSTQADAANPSSATPQRTSASTSALLSQHTQSQGYDIMDDSLDFLLRKVDDDIVRDKVELLEWEQEQEHQSSTQEQTQQAESFVAIAAEMEEDDINSEQDENDNDSDSVDETGVKQKVPRFKRGLRQAAIEKLLNRIEVFVRLECLPAIIYLAFLWLRVPISFMDIHRLMVDERIPYTSLGRLVPSEISTRLGTGGMRIFDVAFPPSVSRIKRLVAAMEMLYKKHYSLLFPLPDTPLVLLSIMHRLDLPIDIYPMALQIIELAEAHEDSSAKFSDDIYLSTMAAIVICLKLHYGLDEIERTSSQQDSAKAELDLPPLHEFLKKWRSDWTREFSIGALPYLTAYGGHWIRDFASYYERVTQRPYIPGYKKEFKNLATRYRHTLDILTASSTLDSDVAGRVLPSEYTRNSHSDKSGRLPTSNERSASTSNGNRSQSSNDSPPGINLLNVSANLSKSLLLAEDTRQQKCPYTGIAEPFDHYPWVKIQRGERYPIFTTQTRRRLPGYMIPTLGLVLARCAMIIGISQKTLLQRITELEIRLQERVDASHPPC
ncbi:hypothetical protein H4R20_001944 [Coemansia guatemalensis]|uniref:RRN7-type domain-containing protein n=1 Tax=Coemansia guatemalensis TaxID=2761395 RepID=A0A9W8I2C7_9FUNG|nr:hypothetical protein H4R20_001944 [Coemansia guatemalensis]